MGANLPTPGAYLMNAQHDSRSALRSYHLRGRLYNSEHTLVLLPGEHLLGRAKANDLTLPVSEVSRQHARLTYDLEPSGEARFRVTDLGSCNGTFVNGEKVTASAVHVGDVVRFGPVELQLEEIEPGDAELAVVLRPRSRTTDVSPAAEDPITVVCHGARKDRAFLHLTFPESHVPGRSKAMEGLYRAMGTMADTDLPVLIEGETGVGKESVARTLHLSSRRVKGPFVAVNCAAIPAELLEAEMFGIGANVATGVEKRPGKFREAAGGTLLLDEIAEMPAGLQAKLLRALQGKEIQPLGSRPVRVDVWVLTATNLDLIKSVSCCRLPGRLFFAIHSIYDDFLMGNPERFQCFDPNPVSSSCSACTQLF